MYHALIRTHHITSRKKIAVLRKAADRLSCYVLIKHGRPPGIMYCEGPEYGVQQWVETVNRLRYKDYQLICRPAQVFSRRSLGGNAGLHDTSDIKIFANEMDSLGLLEWWRMAMGYSSA